MAQAWEREIERVDKRIDRVLERLDEHLEKAPPALSHDTTPLRVVGAIATLLAALGAFITPIMVVLVQ